MPDPPFGISAGILNENCSIFLLPTRIEITLKCDAAKRFGCLPGGGYKID
jgi:hypothetical protein